MNYDICNSPALQGQKKLTFGNLTRGDIFRSEGYLYFRPNIRADVPYNAISLVDGEYENFDDDESVELYVATITLFEDYFKSEQEN